MTRSTPLLLLISISLSPLSGCTSSGSQPSDSTARPVAAIPMPRFDGIITPQEWDDATRLNGTFTIHDGGKADGSYPFNLWMGATQDALLLAIKVYNGTPNPFNTPNATWADHVDFFFSMNGTGNLTPPSFDITAATYPGSSFIDRAFWNGHEWETDPDDDGVALKNGQPTGGTWAIAHSDPGTTSFEVYTPRYPAHAIRNGLRLPAGAEFHMAFSYMRQGDIDPGSISPDARGDFRWPHSVFPGDGYNPFGMYHPQEWLTFKMR